jgi:ABC-2 type transport system permease protein
MWFIGALTPHFFFLQFVALLIGSGATAEEYGQGTADIILSKPISKMSYLIGKFLGGLTLFSFIALLTTILAILLSTFTFGAQSYLEFAPVVYFSLVFSTLVFFSFGFVMGEVFRSPTIAYLIASSIYIMSFILSPFLVFANSLTGDPFYLDISRALPTWSVQNFPIIISQELFLGFDSIPFISSGPVIGGTLIEAFTGILVYSSIGIGISFFRFLRTDVTKKSID